MNPHTLAVGATVSAVANLAMVALLAGAVVIIRCQGRKLTKRADLAVENALLREELRSAGDEVHRLMAENDNLIAAEVDRCCRTITGEAS